MTLDLDLDSYATLCDEPPIHAESQHHHHLTSQSDHVVVEAYAVEDPEDPPSAVVVDTCFGIERKRLIIIASVSTAAIAIIFVVLTKLQQYHALFLLNRPRIASKFT